MKRGASRWCIAPWYSFAARGFVPRLYLLDRDGWPLGHVDGADALLTYEAAFEASRLLWTYESAAGT